MRGSDLPPFRVCRPRDAAGTPRVPGADGGGRGGVGGSGRGPARGAACGRGGSAALPQGGLCGADQGGGAAGGFPAAGRRYDPVTGDVGRGDAGGRRGLCGGGRGGDARRAGVCRLPSAGAPCGNGDGDGVLFLRHGGHRSNAGVAGARAGTRRSARLRRASRQRHAGSAVGRGAGDGARRTRSSTCRCRRGPAGRRCGRCGSLPWRRWPRSSRN